MQFTLPIVLSIAGSAIALPSQHNAVLQARDAYIDTILSDVNGLRSQYQAAPLNWDDGLAGEASNSANTCDFAHTNSGQNLYMSPDNGDPASIASSAFQSWGGEVSNYQYFGQEPDMSRFSDFGHFTQMVWKSTTSIGCATATQCGGNALTVCNFGPPGNVDGQYAANV